MQIDQLLYNGRSETLNVTCSGEYGVGSKGQASGAVLTEVLRQWMADHADNSIAVIEIDYTAVDYGWGDGPVSSMTPLVRGAPIRFRLIADASNCDSLKSLLEACKVPFFELVQRSEVNGQVVFTSIPLSFGPRQGRVSVEERAPRVSSRQLGEAKVSTTTQTVSGGYFLVYGTAPKVHQDMLPELVWTPSDYVCERYPYSWCEPDVAAPPESEIERGLSRLGLERSDLPVIQSWVAHHKESGRLGDLGVFFEPNLAREFAARFVRSRDRFKLLGIGLPASYVEQFLAETVDSHDRKTLTRCGICQAVNAGLAMAEGGTALGYEPLGFEPCTRPGLMNHISEEWPVKAFSNDLNAYGIFAELSACIRAVDAQVEQAVWSPWLIVEYRWPEVAVI
jgi:hypothetical protein